ncbi:GtrA family protein [Novosphingobium decolorationis]|uniref:GtrA family protein n=1 Tax=Novosphingobium decolorationis TaxID=2698673 RepID=A0ABX8E8R3_9SPHN|nr:GtrA family protein [Novosphingobium decolorationis]QVM84590.1 GtrA family protein [Novosphingobium decolorationis]
MPPRSNSYDIAPEATSSVPPEGVDPGIGGRGFLRRVLTRKGLDLYLRNALASVATFLLDLAFIWVLAEKAGAGRLLAVALGFLLANALHYVLARIWIFRGSARGMASGYVLFVGNALVGLGLILGAFTLLSDVLGVPYLAARIAASLVAGTAVFLFNATVNFRKL